jgi:hypothetical protein
MSEGESKPRVLSLDQYRFNFTVDRKAMLRARMGAPAFALRRKRLDRSLEAFWLDLEQRYERLWVAAGDGRIDEEGRELRHLLLDDEGRDIIGHWEHRRLLFKDRTDPAEAQRDAFARAWRRHVGRCALEPLVRQVDDYNRYFPIEANLSTDPGTGRFLWMGTVWHEAVAPTREDVLARFPIHRS